MLAKSWEVLKVNSAKAKEVLMLGSEGLKMEGSTSPGPGLTRNWRGVSMENQMRAPARRGMVQYTVLPGAPRAIEMFCEILVPVDEGLGG